MKLLIQPQDGVGPLLSAIKKAKKFIDILIFRLDWKEIEAALKAASERGVAVRALIAQTNRGGEAKLRSLEMRFLEAGITVTRTAGDLVRYHGKMMIIDRKTLFLLSFNFVHLDIDHSRGFGIVTSDAKLVKEALQLFDADSNRTSYVPGHHSFIVSPLNAREKLADFIGKARKELLIYDPQVGDPEIIRLLNEKAREGVVVRIIGTIAARKANLPVAPLSVMRLHTRTMVRDGNHAFIGSQSLRPLELDSRREIGIMVRDPRIVDTLRKTFEKDWESTGFGEPALNPVKAEEECAQASEALEKQMAPLADTVKHAVERAVAKSRSKGLRKEDVSATVKGVVKEAVKAAVKELIHQDMVQE